MVGKQLLRRELSFLRRLLWENRQRYIDIGLSCALKCWGDKLCIPIIMVKKIPEAEACPICLAEIANHSTPDSCAHAFCHRCIKKWSSKENTCPLCKHRFSTILRRPRPVRATRKARGARVRRESVSESRQRSEEELLEDSIINALCGRSTRKGECSMLIAYALLDQMAIED